MIPTDNGTSLNTANLVAYFENARRVSNYLVLVDSWRSVATALASQGVEPPPPPIPFYSVIGITDSTGSAATRETKDYVYPMPDQIHVKPVVPGTCGVFLPSAWQDPSGRIWVQGTVDNEPAGYVAVVPPGTPNIKPGSYVKQDAISHYPSWNGPSFYDPA